MRDRLALIAAYAAPTVVLLQDQAHARTENAPGIITEFPALGPGAIAAAAAALATIGAYRLHKSRNRSGPGDAGPKP